MSAKRVADVVAQIDYPGGRRFVKVGALLQMENNDDSKGPGFVVMLDKWFNPAGIPSKFDDSVALSTYWPKEKEEHKPSTHKATRPAGNAEQREERAFREMDDDIPF